MQIITHRHLLITEQSVKVLQPTVW